MALQIRRGLEADRPSITPLDGEAIWTTDTKRLYIGDGTTAGGVLVNSTTLRTIILPSPAPGDNIAILRFKKNAILTSISEVVDGAGSPSVTWNLKFATNRNEVSPTKVFTTDITTTTEAGSIITAFDNANIPDDNWMWLTISAASGSLVSYLTLVLEYVEY